jgi:queuine tRNA-ribosyltransferase
VPSLEPRRCAQLTHTRSRLDIGFIHTATHHYYGDMTCETFNFRVDARDGAARAATITTAHGEVATPAFMPVGTTGTVKAMTSDSIRSTGAAIVLGNTYHLMLRPGADRIARHGGLHRFMDWPGPILTDSGGFQVMSLAKLRKLDADGVTFQSHIDGTTHRLTPARSIEIQRQLDATITMAFDECTSFPATRDEARRSLELSMRWAVRSRDSFVRRPGYGLFGIVQGSVYPDFRAEAAAGLCSIGFDGHAIGGLAVGEGQLTMFNVLDATVPHLPADRPRYLMGVGTPDDIVGAVRRGIDMFDCVIPTRGGRTARAFTSRGIFNLRNARFADDDMPLDPNCVCPACVRHSRAYVHHLFKAGEMLGPILLTWHNLQYYQALTRGLRQAIQDGQLTSYSDELRASWSNPEDFG